MAGLCTSHGGDVSAPHRGVGSSRRGPKGCGRRCPRGGTSSGHSASDARLPPGSSPKRLNNRLANCARERLACTRPCHWQQHRRRLRQPVRQGGCQTPGPRRPTVAAGSHTTLASRCDEQWPTHWARLTNECLAYRPAADRPLNMGQNGGKLQCT